MGKKKIEQEPEEVLVYNIKNPLYRQIHIDGAVGGITPSGYINLNAYANRFSIPKSVLYELKDGEYGQYKAYSEDSKEGIIQEIEIGLYFDLDVAKNLRDFLNDNIKALEKFDKKK